MTDSYKKDDMGEGVSRIAKKNLTYFMDGPLNYFLNICRKDLLEK